MKRFEVLKTILPRFTLHDTDEGAHVPVLRCQEAFSEGSIAAVTSARYVLDHPCSDQALLIVRSGIPNARIGGRGEGLVG